jgi:putative hydrolase of the HAD superfamily
VHQFVIFDLFHTLVHGADDERDRVVARMGGIVGVDPAALVGMYHANWRQRLTEWGAEQTVWILAKRLGGCPSPAQVAQAVALRGELAGCVLAAASSATTGVLDSLRDAGWRLGLVSNATAETAEAWPGCPLAGRFDVAVFSCDVAVAKPDPRIYLAAVEGLDARPADCVYVGDGADGELAGAAALGMPVIRTTEHNDTDPSWPGPSIASILDLQRALHVASTRGGWSAEPGDVRERAKEHDEKRIYCGPVRGRSGRQDHRWGSSRSPCASCWQRPMVRVDPRGGRAGMTAVTAASWLGRDAPPAPRE